jgi:hypothetical protein
MACADVANAKAKARAIHLVIAFLQRERFKNDFLESAQTPATRISSRIAKNGLSANIINGGTRSRWSQSKSFRIKSAMDAKVAKDAWA